MSLSLRHRLALFTLALGVSAFGTLILFFGVLYSVDKRLTLQEASTQAMRRSANTLDNLVRFSGSFDLEGLGKSPKVVFAADEACKPDQRFVISKPFELELQRIGLDAASFLGSTELTTACSERTSAAVDTDGLADARVVDFGPKLTVPVAGFLLRSNRLLVLSLEKLAPAHGGILLLLDRRGKVAWASESGNALGAALSRLGATDMALSSATSSILSSKGTYQGKVGGSGSVVAVPALGSYALAHLSKTPSAIDLIGSRAIEVAYLVAALLLASLLLSRGLGFFVVRPLVELGRAADRIGTGDFSFRIEPKGGSPEFVDIYRSMNTMTERLAKLVGEFQRKVELESDFQVTRSVQTLLFPPLDVDLGRGRCRLAAFADTATQCGGDLWGYLDARAPDGRPLTIVLIGDVTGHGVSSALMTAAARGGIFVLNQWVQSDPSLALEPGKMLSLLNKSVHDSGKGKMDMTFFLVVVDHAQHRILCANAAHVQSYLMHTESSPAAKKIAAIGVKSGIVLGANGNSTYESETHEWYPGSKLFLYTDGLTDVIAADGKNLYERKTLRKAVSAHQGEPGPQLLTQIMQERGALAEGLPKVDDVTVVVVEETPA